MTVLTAEQRRLRAQKAAHSAHAKYGGEHMTRNARRAFDVRFVDEVDPDRVLPIAERTDRANQARSAYFRGLALKSSQARSNRSAGKS